MILLYVVLIKLDHYYIIHIVLKKLIIILSHSFFGEVVFSLNLMEFILPLLQLLFLELMLFQKNSLVYIMIEVCVVTIVNAIN